MLTNGAVPCKRMSCLLNSLIGWASSFGVDFDNSSPFGKSNSHGVVLFCSSSHTIKTHSGSLIFSSFDCGKSDIDLDSWNDSFSSEGVNEFNTVLSSVSSSLVVQDCTRDIVGKSRSGEQKISVSNSVFMGVLQLDLLESISNCSSGLVRGENTFSWGSKGLGSLHQLVNIQVLGLVRNFRKGYVLLVVEHHVLESF